MTLKDHVRAKEACCLQYNSTSGDYQLNKFRSTSVVFLSFFSQGQFRLENIGLLLDKNPSCCELGVNPEPPGCKASFLEMQPHLSTQPQHPYALYSLVNGYIRISLINKEWFDRQVYKEER